MLHGASGPPVAQRLHVPGSDEDEPLQESADGADLDAPGVFPRLVRFEEAAYEIQLAPALESASRGEADDVMA